MENKSNSTRSSFTLKKGNEYTFNKGASKQSAVVEQNIEVVSQSVKVNILDQHSDLSNSMGSKLNCTIAFQNKFLKTDRTIRNATILKEN